MLTKLVKYKIPLVTLYTFSSLSFPFFVITCTLNGYTALNDLYIKWHGFTHRCALYEFRWQKKFVQGIKTPQKWIWLSNFKQEVRKLNLLCLQQSQWHQHNIWGETQDHQFTIVDGPRNRLAKCKMAAANILKIHFNGHKWVPIAHVYTKVGWETKTDVPET